MARRVGPASPVAPAWGVHPGLCISCAQARVITGAQSVFWMCGLAASDPHYRRYPALPVLSCRGHTAGRPLTTETAAEP